MPKPDFLTSAEISATHGFFTRQGGVSTGLFESLNCSLSNSDEPANRIENRKRVCEAMAADDTSLSSLWQVHGNKVLTLDAPLDPANRPQADGMVTKTAGITLGIVTADCAPILLHDPVANIIGAAHSGWKSTLGNIALETVKAMVVLGAVAENISAAVGPCIAYESYEVSPDFPLAFMERGFGLFFKPSVKPLHHMFDLSGCIRSQLRAAGVGKVDILPNDTYSEEDKFFSNRRATHRSEPAFGLQISCIRL